MCVAKSAIFRQNKQKSPKTVKNILIYYTNRVVFCRIQTRFVFNNIFTDGLSFRVPAWESGVAI